MIETFTIEPDQATKIASWFKSGRGVVRWSSLDLARAGDGVFTPADSEKPAYHYANPVPLQPEQFRVTTYKEVKRFRIALVQRGFKIMCSDGASRRIRAACAKFEGSIYQFDYDTQEAVILVPDGEPKPLTLE